MFYITIPHRYVVVANDLPMCWHYERHGGVFSDDVMR